MLLELINFKETEHDIEYLYFLNGIEKKIKINKTEKINYTDISVAYEILENEIKSVKKQTERKTKIIETGIFDSSISINFETNKREPTKIKNMQDIDFKLIIDDIFKIDKNVDLEFFKSTLKEFTKRFYSNKLKGNLNRKDLIKIREMVFYFFLNSNKEFENLQSLKFQDKQIKKFIETSDEINLLKLILDLEKF
ncbi:hypothetical protein PT447_00060 [Aliarcobacter butzleri]|uniref:hypothetical protein n=1 Tax=Aliarcobacter butzleri TaxID=28197 RepID=UPI0024DDFF5E|nr:hypothetical protein [Aliarcobacter butzleri]MDK2063312.1 hypothetical protein [Aliarcobacter butzleri]